MSAAHVDGASATDALHVGSINDADNGVVETTTGIVAQTVLVASVFGNPALRVRNISAGLGTGIQGEGGTANDLGGFPGGVGVAGIGGAHTLGTPQPTSRGGNGVDGTGGATNSGGAIAGDGVSGIGGQSSTSNTRHGAGVRGLGQGTVGLQGPGVIGETVSSVHPAVGGFNTGFGFGVLGSSSAGSGVRGIAYGASAAGTEGVASGAGPGVWGFASSGHGVLGNSTTGNGGVFSGKTGLTSTGSPNAVVANGNVFCTGTGHFNGGLVVSTREATGGLQATYGMTSPDAMLEDVGRVRLTNGSARVELDPRFAALINSADYDVFATPRGDCNGLFVSAQSASGFELRELRGGTSSVEVGYRVVAKRVGAARFARVDEPTPVSIPETPRLPPAGGYSYMTRGATPSTPRSDGGPDVSPPPPTRPAPRDRSR